MTDQLQQLKQHSLVVADTGDLEAIRRYQPQDATTNPSLLLKAFSLPGYQAMIDEELSQVKAAGGARERSWVRQGELVACRRRALSALSSMSVAVRSRPGVIEYSREMRSTTNVVTAPTTVSQKPDCPNVVSR